MPVDPQKLEQLKAIKGIIERCTEARLSIMRAIEEFDEKAAMGVLDEESCKEMIGALREEADSLARSRESAVQAYRRIFD